MKKLLLGFLLLAFLISCGNKKAKMDPFATITEMVDSAGHKADTLLEAEVKEAGTEALPTKVICLL